MKILVAYDGTLHAKKAVRYGIAKLRETVGELTVLQVFESARFVDYGAGPAAEAAGRRETAVQLEEAKRIIAESGAGIPTQVLMSEGDVLTLLQEQAAAAPPDLLLLPPRFKNAVKAVACPATVIPGPALVPIDSSGSSASIEAIVREAQGLGGPVLLLGVVPVHLFGQEEKGELTLVRRSTERALQQLSAELRKRGLETRTYTRDGYPDEEITAAANEHQVSVVLLPTGSTTPSELTKAAVILSEEQSSLPWPVVLVPEQGMA